METFSRNFEEIKRLKAEISRLEIENDDILMREDLTSSEAFPRFPSSVVTLIRDHAPCVSAYRATTRNVLEFDLCASASPASSTQISEVASRLRQILYLFEGWRGTDVRFSGRYSAVDEARG